jgi:two-component system phosphate regulon sensor histidine kinase PhoR
MPHRADRSRFPFPFYEQLLPGSLRLRLVLPFVALFGIVLLVLTLALGQRANDIYIERLSEDIAIEARTVADVYLLARDQSGGDVELAGIISLLPDQADRRITLIDGNGVVMADTAVNDLDRLEDHAGREEIQTAVSGGTGVATRMSTSVGERFLYVAVPLGDGSDTVLRIAVPLTYVDAVVDDVQRYLVVAAMVALALAVALAVFIGFRLAEPLEGLRSHAQRVADGDLDAQVAPSPTREIDAVGSAFNMMTARLRQSLDDLATTSIRLEAVLGGLDDGVVLTDDHGNVLRMNEAAERMLVIRENAAMGQPFLHAARDHELDALLQAALQGRQRQPEAVEYGLHRRTLLSSASTVEGQAERLGLVVLRDITELRKLEGVRRDFVANVSHELRTPLTSIRAMVETIETGAIDEPEMMQEFMRRIIGEIDQLTALVEDLLDMARLEAGRSPLKLAHVQADDLVRVASERLRAQVERARLELRYRLPADLPEVLVDRRQIAQVVVNLVHNAIKFTPPGGSVTLSAYRDSDRVIVDVIDTGVGIAEAELPRLFERFYKSDKARRSEGTGLGLAIAKHIMQAHGGDVTVESRPGEGAKFSFSLLVAGSEDAALLRARSSGSLRSATSSTRRSTIGDSVRRSSMLPS